MTTSVQFTGTLAPNQTNRWTTSGWPANLHIIWYMVPVSSKVGVPQITWEVAVGRTIPNQCTYWITVKNLTGVMVTFEGRYAILNS
ncbi:MAG: hypothetical protein U0Z53_23135 [Blastocatellia bacterium]